MSDDTDNNIPPSGHRYSREAGLFVSKGSVLFVTMLILLLFFMAYQNSSVINGFGRLSLNEDIGPSCQTEQCLRFQLEGEHLRMQTAKVSSVTFYRFGLSSMGFMASLITIVLGSVLIFDRVIGSERDHAAVSWRDYFLSFGSTFPGSLMVAFGTLSLIVNLWVSGPKSPPIYIETRPLYLTDVNTQYRSLGLANAFAYNASASEVIRRREAQKRGQVTTILPDLKFEGEAVEETQTHQNAQGDQ